MTMTNVATIPNPQRTRLEFGYDHMNRRISKVVKTWNGSSFTSPVTNLFVYDGWNLLAELNPLHSSLCTYLWGQDLSGTMDGAGGVGGLLMVVRQASPSTNCFVAFDGNGNVTALVNAVSGAMEARYEYSPYGEILRTTGPLASNNPFRWSTKFWDEESGLVYYGYRYYSSIMGRWISRDPIEEEGGLNLFSFLSNGTPNKFDPYGNEPAFGGGKEDVRPSDPRWINASDAEIDAEIDRCKGDPKRKGFAKQLRKWKKVRKTEKYRDRYGHAPGRQRGQGGFARVGGLAVGAAATVVLYAYEKLATAVAVQDMRDLIGSGWSPGLGDIGSASFEMYDFVRHLDSGDTLWAEFDAVNYAITQGGSIAAWDAFTEEIQETP